MFDSQGRRFRKPPACRQCRKRKIGCDRVKPICGNCFRSGKHDCAYPELIGGSFEDTGSGYDDNGSSHNNGGSSNFNQGVQIYRSKETSQLLKDNPELASMEQIREYNTRQQLLNSQNANKNETPISLETAKFIPRTTTKLTSSMKHLLTTKKVISANDDDLGLNWIQGPAIMDLSHSNYVTRDLILKEYNFIKLRLLELQEITGKKIRVDLDMLDRDGNNNGTQSESDKRSPDGSASTMDNNSSIGKQMGDNLADNHLHKKKKIKLLQSTSNSFAMDELSNYGSELLDPKDLFTILDNNSDNGITNNMNNNNSENETNDALIIVDNPNLLFSTNYLVKRDKFLENYYKKIENVVGVSFNHLLPSIVENNNKNKYSQGYNDHISFPSKIIMRDVLDQFHDIFSADDIASMFFIDDLESINNNINKFGRDPKFSRKSLNIESLVSLGELSVIALLVQEYISLMDENSMGKNLKELLKNLMTYNDLFLKNILLIKNILPKREGFLNTLQSLQFFSLLQFFEMISVNNVDFGLTNYDDIFLARKFSLNYETENINLNKFWNFIFKNYCYRNVLKGDIPAMVMSNDFNTSIISDPQLLTDIKLLESQTKLLKYMHLPANAVSIKKVELMRNNLEHLSADLKNKDIYKVLDSGINGPTEFLSNYVNMSKMINAKYMLRLEFMLLLQYNKLKDAVKLETTILSLFGHITEIFEKVATYLNSDSVQTRLLTSKCCLNIIDDMLSYCISIFQQILFSFTLQSTNASVDEASKLSLGKCLDEFGLLFKGIKFTLEEVTRKYQQSTAILSKILCRAVVALKYWTLCNQDYQSRTIVNQHSAFDGISTYDKLEEGRINNIDEILKKFKSAMKTPEVNSTEETASNDARTLGITESNVSDVYASFFM
ncbi:hypothetical protein TPHA_0D01900 [Tetrapisispora phaffii CBS 4417]|uniref:Zn(2)-C6 fungal-type domain-containing protein n=1 Tax=Tetrapisispora phaffii (strain ATCC 24235 / CBS 4417 / NBRC 1672 / NRRL Y-8282 / UCD 70-5) TaxID=1071381 RepID=G8BSK8_TETPH|nr:hypothetical protein TPHA_0D01900 [Tetrapisispora phaffii CBS 4417]CCE62829.1 hypothetical protein TPHA_0D01900 [Tetrapisispora phaffii CBS 4417]